MDHESLSKLKVEELSNIMDELHKYHKLIYEVLKNKDEFVHVSSDSEYASSTEEESEEEEETIKEEYEIQRDEKGFYSLRECVVKIETLREVLTRD